MADGGTLHCGGVEEDAEGRGSDLDSDPAGETGLVAVLEAGGMCSHGEKGDADAAWDGTPETGACGAAGVAGCAAKGRNDEPG